jgi:hypothetical protein
METIAVPLSKVQDWQRLLRAVHGQVAENMRPGQGKAEVMFTLENMAADMNMTIVKAPIAPDPQDYDKEDDFNEAFEDYKYRRAQAEAWAKAERGE